jgi:hypothetical protein
VGQAARAPATVSVAQAARVAHAAADAPAAVLARASADQAARALADVPAMARAARARPTARPALATARLPLTRRDVRRATRCPEAPPAPLAAAVAVS